MKEAAPCETDVRNLIQELHNHTRHNMALWVQWFTFFVTVNYVALGWFAEPKERTPVLFFAPPVPSGRSHAFYVAGMFVVQCILGVWVSISLRRWFIKADRQLYGLYEWLTVQRVEPVFSLPFYETALLLGTMALIVIIAAWVSLAFP